MIPVSSRGGDFSYTPAILIPASRGPRKLFTVAPLGPGHLEKLRLRKAFLNSRMTPTGGYLGEVTVSRSETAGEFSASLIAFEWVISRQTYLSLYLSL